jgi:hypothetical protein
VATIRASPSHHGEELRWLEFLLKKNGSGPEIQTDVRCKYMAVLSGPMPAAELRGNVVAGFNSWFAPAARSAKTDACGRSFAVLSTQVSTVGLRLG